MSLTPIRSLYVHLPFCSQICPFCAFAVLPEPKAHLPYLDLLAREWKSYQERFNFDFSLLGSVYFGGGTPSRLTLDEWARLLDWLPISAKEPQVQWTLELNPEDVSFEYAVGLIQLGFNRVSLGVQSFDDPCLAALGRAHRDRDNQKAIDCLTRAGFVDLNLDFIFGYPGQSEISFVADLESLVQSPATHLSAYALGIERGSKIYRQKRWSQFIEAHEEKIAEQYLRIIDHFGAAGFGQYEVSNFSLPGKQSKQNQSNWAGEPYLGLGLSAHGYMDGVRYGNFKHFKDYKQAVLTGTFPWLTQDRLTGLEKQEEAWMLGLRQPKGVDLRDFFKKPAQVLPRLLASVPAGLLLHEGTRISLSQKGMLLADELSSHLLSRQGLELDLHT